jgi:hypothetical protein
MCSSPSGRALPVYRPATAFRHNGLQSCASPHLSVAAGHPLAARNAVLVVAEVVSPPSARP